MKFNNNEIIEIDEAHLPVCDCGGIILPYTDIIVSAYADGSELGWKCSRCGKDTSRKFSENIEHDNTFGLKILLVLSVGLILLMGSIILIL